VLHEVAGGSPPQPPAVFGLTHPEFGDGGGRFTSRSVFVVEKGRAPMPSERQVIDSCALLKLVG